MTKRWKSGEKLKLGKIVEKFWKFENIYVFGNIWKFFGNLDDRKFVKRNLEII